MDDAYIQLRAELNRTAVISDHFKSEILQWAVQLMREAHARGRADEKAEQEKRKVKE